MSIVEAWLGLDDADEPGPDAARWNPLMVDDPSPLDHLEGWTAPALYAHMTASHGMPYWGADLEALHRGVHLGGA